MNVKVVARSNKLIDWFYLPAILSGLRLTIGHFFVNLLTQKKIVTIKYPEEKRPISPRWRARHRLTRNKNGFIKCVACYMCETICPARCIHIEAAEQVNDKSVEKYPRVFDIDELRCVFCGLCVEACPEDAIRMDTDVIGMAYSSRSKYEFTRNMLLDDHQETDTSKYSKVPLPSSEKLALPKGAEIAVKN